MGFQDGSQRKLASNWLPGRDSHRAFGCQHQRSSVERTRHGRPHRQRHRLQFWCAWQRSGRLELDDPYQRSLLNHSLGVLLSRVGDYNAAHTCYLRSLEIDHEIGDRAGMAWTQNNLGLLYNHLGDAKTGLAYHNEALRSSRERGARTVQGIAYLGIGQDLYELGRLDASCTAYRAALAIQDEFGQNLRAVEAKSGLARSLLALKQTSEALVLVNEVLDYLATNTLQGARQPFLVYLNCFRVLQGNNDPRAASLLREAYLLLQQQADLIENAAWRDSFLHNIQTHQALLQEYGTLSAPPANEHAHISQPHVRRESPM